MNNLTYLLLVLFSYFGNAQSKQENSSDFVVTYQIDSKNFENFDDTTTEIAELIVKKNETSVFILRSMILLDSIQSTRALSTTDLTNNKTFLYYLIKRDKDATSHIEYLGGEIFKFDESIVFDWLLIDEQKEIGGYLCKKATVQYAGRKWIAWYAVEIPVNAGPYKFYGLPGLILEIKDSESFYHFSALNIKRKNFTLNSKISNYFATEGNSTIEEIEKNEFYQIRKKFYKMSLQESFQYMNRKEGGAGTIVITSPTTGEKTRPNLKFKVRNFIEVYD